MLLVPWASEGSQQIKLLATNPDDFSSPETHKSPLVYTHRHKVNIYVCKYIFKLYIPKLFCILKHFSRGSGARL